MTQPGVIAQSERQGVSLVQQSFNITWAPGDGQVYQALAWLPASSQAPQCFFAIGRAGTPLTGAFLPWTTALTFVAYVDTLAVSKDLDLQLLWAGWRLLQTLHGLPDPTPPSDLPAWRPGWAAELVYDQAAVASNEQQR